MSGAANAFRPGSAAALEDEDDALVQPSPKRAAQTTPEFLLARARWVTKVVNFMHTRRMLTLKWASMSSGALDSGRQPMAMPTPHPTLTLPATTNPNSALPAFENLGDLYHAATLAKPVFDDVFGKLMTKWPMQMGAQIHPSWRHWTAYMRGILAPDLTPDETGLVPPAPLPHPAFIAEPLKDRELTTAKAKLFYGQQIHLVRDCVRGSIVVTSEDQLQTTLAAIEKLSLAYAPHASALPSPYARPCVRVVSCKNRFKTPSPVGYRDVLVTVLVDYEETHKKQQLGGHGADLVLDGGGEGGDDEERHYQDEEEDDADTREEKARIRAQISKKREIREAQRQEALKEEAARQAALDSATHCCICELQVATNPNPNPNLNPN